MFIHLSRFEKVMLADYFRLRGSRLETFARIAIIPLFFIFPFSGPLPSDFETSSSLTVDDLNTTRACVPYLLKALWLRFKPIPSFLGVKIHTRFGNNFRAFTKAVFCCLCLRIPNLIISNDLVLFRESFVTTCGIRVIVMDPVSFQKVKALPFYYLDIPCYDSALQDTVRSFRHAFWDLYRNVSVSPEIIYFHLRAGDIFGPPPVHRAYGQPPCSFYLEAARLHGKRKRMVIATDGGDNPCIKDLEKKGAVVDYSPVEVVIGRLIHARRFALSRSSFSEAMAKLSVFHETGRFYTFGDVSENMAGHWNCEPTAIYQRDVLANWTNSDRQLNLMRKDRCGGWSFIYESRVRSKCDYCSTTRGDL
jgi:hypothetical protein